MADDHVHVHVDGNVFLLAYVDANVLGHHALDRLCLLIADRKTYNRQR